MQENFVLILHINRNNTKIAVPIIPVFFIYFVYYLKQHNKPLVPQCPIRIPVHVVDDLTSNSYLCRKILQFFILIWSRSAKKFILIDKLFSFSSCFICSKLYRPRVARYRVNMMGHALMTRRQTRTCVFVRITTMGINVKSLHVCI